MNMKGSILGIALVVSLASCDVLGIGPCESDIQAGIRISLEDEVTGGPILEGVRAVAASPGHTDTTRVVGLSSAGLAVLTLVQDVAGTYSVMIEARGYEAWQRDGVVVRNRDHCHVRTVELTAVLTPLARGGQTTVPQA